MADHTMVDTKQQARLMQHIVILQRTRLTLLQNMKTRTKKESTNFKAKILPLLA
jgi:hypothetical protein